jgi:hypothetical protein
MTIDMRVMIIREFKVEHHLTHFIWNVRDLTFVLVRVLDHRHRYTLLILHVDIEREVENVNERGK